RPHVGCRPENDAHARHGRCRDRRRVRQSWTVAAYLTRWSSISVDQLRQTKVENLHLAVWCDLDIGRFQIAVNYAFVVSSFECIRDLPGDGQRLSDWKRALGNPIRESRSLHQLEHERMYAVGPFE